MEDSCRIESIDTDLLDVLIDAYPDIVPDTLSHLDQQRYELLPHALRERGEIPYLTKSEVAVLVDWKLSHGKFRPTLKGLFNQNTEQAVHDATRDAFATFSRSSESAKASINTLTKLRGVGPATASLLLSVYDPQHAPFFSDELFRWCMYEKGKGKGWDREIKYNLREYLQLFEMVHRMQIRLSTGSQREVDAVDIEKIAYVLGKRAQQASIEPVANGPHLGEKRKATASEPAPPQDSNKSDRSISKVVKMRKSERKMRQSTSQDVTPSKKRASIGRSTQKPA